jgi:hypothetical protein
MSYYITIYGTTINEDQVVVPMEEGNPLYIDYVTYLQNNGEVFETDYLSEVDLAIQRKLLVPQEVKRWRIKRILEKMNLITDVENALNQLPEPTKGDALAVWNEGTEFERGSSTIKFLQNILLMTEEQVDNIFIQAQEISI